MCKVLSNIPDSDLQMVAIIIIIIIIIIIKHLIF
jgi:hypothetical protein